MSKSELTINPTGTARGLNGRGRLVGLLVGLVVLLGCAFAPAAANAALYFSVNSATGTTVSGTQAYGWSATPSTTLSKTYYMYNSSANISSTTRTGDITLSNPSAFEVVSTGSCSVTTPSPSGATSRISWSNGFSLGSANCNLAIRLKAGLASGQYSSTMTLTNVSNFTSASATLTAVVSAENATIVRLYDPDNAEVSNFDFGGVAIGDSVVRRFTLRNPGNAPMTGASRSVSGSSAYTIDSTTCGATLAMADSCTVDVKYAPTAAATDTGTLSFTSGSGQSKTLNITGTAYAPTADISVTPGSQNYNGVPGGVASGHPASRTFTVNNEGNTSLTLGFNFTGTNASAFSRTGGTCGVTLGVGGDCTVVVQFDPDAGGSAAQTASLEVTGTTPLVGSPATESVALSGTRIAAAATIDPRNTAGTVSVTSHDFGAVSLGGTASYTFVIANTGTVSVPSVTPTLTGPEASSYSITANNCGTTLGRDSTCQVTVTLSAQLASQRRATLVLTPGAAAITAGVKTVSLSAAPTGIRIKNDVADTFSNPGSQKRWMDTTSLAPGGTGPADIIRVAFEVELPEGSDVAGVDIVNGNGTGGSPPSSTYQSIGDLLGGRVVVERKPGSSQALVKASVPLSATAMGTDIGTYGFSDGTKLSGACISGGNYENTGRNFWFRVRGSNGEVTPTVGSPVRLHNQLYTCYGGQGPVLSGQRILSVGGNTLPGGTMETTAGKNQPVRLQFATLAKVKGPSINIGFDIQLPPTSDGTVEAVDVRIRNTKTGDMFRWNGSSYVACADPCVVTNSTNRYNFTEGNAANLTHQIEIPGPPSRGRWVIEGSPQGSDENDESYFLMGIVNVNDQGGTSPSITKGGTLGLRPNTDEAYSISAAVADPADPANAYDTQGGRGQVIEWDLDGDLENGPRGDGFEILHESDPSTNLPSEDLTQIFDTTGKTPGPYTIRARVTDNGAFMANDPAAQSRIMTYTTTINSPAEAEAAVHEFESDDTQAQNVPFTASDVDNDAYRVDITPNGSNTGSLGGNLNDGIGNNTKPYTWPVTFTGSDTFDFVATDDHNGQGGHETLTIRVRPNTQIDSSTVSGLLHPDESNPTTRFLGSTTSTSASFDFSSLQNPVTSMECKLTNDGEIVEDWSDCAATDNGSISFSNLADGLHRLEVRAVNDEGDKDGTPAFRTWRVDNTAPDTEVFVGPPSNLPNQQPRFTNDSTPTYKFRATASERSLQQYMTYECRVMWGPVAGTWYPCGSPSDASSSSAIDIINGTPDFGFSSPLADGTYEIQVRGTDEVANLGPAMIERFTVDTLPPETALASGPEGLVNTRTVDYVLGSSQGQSTFRCKLEGTNSGVVFPLGACPGTAADGSRPTFSGLADDTYTLTAIAIDPATNPDPTPLSVAFEVDGTEPTTTMDPQVDFGDGPTLLRRTQSRKVDITFVGNDARQLQGFQCRIDSASEAAWQLCSSPQRFSGLADGDHKVEIRAKDQAGNFDSTPEVLEWNVDHDPPVTTFTIHPDPVSNDSTPTFEFTTNEAISGSVCSLDGAAPVACTSPVSLGDLGVSGGLDDGMHQLTVRSTDLAGNVEQTVGSVSWRQDTVDPEVNLTSKPTAYMPLGNADFAWNVMDGAPLVLAPEVDAECAIDPVDPDNIDSGEWVSCDRELTLAEADNVNGPHVFAVRAIDAAGNYSQIVRHDWVVLGAKPAPPVVDDSSPVDGETTRVGTAYFAFSHELDGTGALDGLFCSLDGETQTRCDGNYGADGLSDGDHTFSVVAKDIAGNISDPTTISWSVQRGAPVTQIDFGPSGASKLSTATFEFSSNKAGTFECKIDGGTWQTCSSPVELDSLTDGAHSFSVRAVSSVAPVGVKDPTPPTRSWSVDTVAPDVTIDSAPEGQIVSYTGNVSFHSTDQDAGFQCKLDEGLFDSCESPLQLTGLSAGEHTISVRAVDPAGNATAEPATRTWVVLDPSCDNDSEGTPPNNCTPKAAVDGPAITAESTGGTLTLAALGSVDLPENQIKLEGKRGSDGRWFVPKEGVKFAPVTQTIPDALGEGTDVGVTISISATGNGWGVLTNGGGQAKMKIPVRADIEAALNGAPLLPSGTTCSLTPVTFDLAGTWDSAAKTAHLEQANVAFPKLTGCGLFKGQIDSLLELPRSDIQMAIDLRLTESAAQTCEPPKTGTFPDCKEPVKNIAIGRPVLKGTKVLKSGKKATYTVTLTNTGDTAATNVSACLMTPKKFIKGKAKRCKTVASIAPGASTNVKFAVRAQKFKLKKARKLNLRATVSYTDGAGAAKTAVGTYKATAGKTGKASGK